MRLTIDNIHVGYEGRGVLRGCSFGFHEAGIYILTGDNGSGKSTLLRVCSLLEKPGSGTLEFSEDSRPLRQDMALRRRMTLVLPRAGLFNRSVYDNVIYGLRLRSIPAGAIRVKADEALDFVGLRDRAGQDAMTLSSGESQRLALARALILEPEILFLDEPTASLDRDNIAIIEEIILKLRDRQRMIIMTTHEEAQARRLGDRVLRLEDGQLRTTA